MIPKLSGTCYAIKLMVHISNINTLRSIYCAYFHSVIHYGIIFGGVTLPTVGRFSLYKKKKYVRIMAGAQPRASCRSLFKQLEILPVPYQYSKALII